MGDSPYGTWRRWKLFRGRLIAYGNKRNFIGNSGPELSGFREVIITQKNFMLPQFRGEGGIGFKGFKMVMVNGWIQDGNG